MLKSQEKGQRINDLSKTSKSAIFEDYEGVSKADDYLEKGFHCKQCNMELTPIEKELYGNRCISHTSYRIVRYSLLRCICKAFLDWEIYNLLVQCRRAFKEKTFYMLTAIIGNAGLQNIGSAVTIKEKKKLSVELQKALFEYETRKA